ncbi:hypothetical protein GQ44DRAFT_621308, partial [Phaeosphaeriaceae sp. PMI808]
GMVSINCVSLMSMATPLGGTKKSGLEKEWDIHTLGAFTNAKTIIINLNY